MLLYSKSHKRPQWYIKKEEKLQEKQHFIRFGRKRMTEWKVYEFFLPFYLFTFLIYNVFPSTLMLDVAMSFSISTAWSREAERSNTK